MFDLASSEASHPDLSIKSLSNNNEDLSLAVKDTSPVKLKFNADEFTRKMDLLDEIKSQNLDDISIWNYIKLESCLDTHLELVPHSTYWTKIPL